MIKPFGTPEETNTKPAYFTIHTFPQGNDIYDIIIETDTEYYERTVFSKLSLSAFIALVVRDNA